MAQRPNLFDANYATALQPPTPMTPKGGSGTMYEDASMTENPQTARRRLMPAVGDVTSAPSTMQQVLDLLRQKAGA